MKTSTKFKTVTILFSLVVLLAACSSTHAKSLSQPITHIATTTTQPPVYCPLTGMPLQPGQSINRPALAVKIDNYPAARPQSALNQADIVFEEPVEGFITRFVAVYNCNSPTFLGPIRSARYEDIGILDQLSSPVFVHAGGIAPIMSLIKSDTSAFNINILANPQIIIHPAGKVPPDSTYMSSLSAWSMDSNDTTPPSPIFIYSSSIPQSFNPSAVTGIHIDYSYTNDETWQWNATDGVWNLYYSGKELTDPSGNPITANNVVVQNVSVTFGPWIEDSLGGKEVVPNFLSGGPATILRNGQAITGLWSRSSLNQPTKFIGSNGQQIPLSPGRTYIEIVPNQVKQNLLTVPSTTSVSTSGSTSASNNSVP
jgi:hypothetical protein